VELVEGAEASVPPKEAAAEAIGVGRRGQATAVAIQITIGIEGREESEWGWAGSVDRPRPELGRLSHTRVGRLGQLA
jgi:hypothetical protein